MKGIIFLQLNETFGVDRKNIGTNIISIFLGLHIRWSYKNYV